MSDFDPLADRASQPESEDSYDPLSQRAAGQTIAPANPAPTRPAGKWSVSGAVNAGIVGAIHALGGALDTAGWLSEHAAQPGEAPGYVLRPVGRALSAAGRYFSSNQYTPQGQETADAVSNELSPITAPLGEAFNWVDQKQRALLGDDRARAVEVLEGEFLPGMAMKGAGKLFGGALGEAGAKLAAKTAEAVGEGTGPVDTQSIGAAAADGGALPQGAPEPLGPPVQGGLPEAAQQARAQTLARVGLSNARESAITGDAMSAGVDAQMANYDQPAGRAAAAQFQAERDALSGHIDRMIDNTGGTIGMDEDALANRGATIARPFQQLHGWFDSRIRQLYSAAEERASGLQGGAYDTSTGATSLTDLHSVDGLLKDESFRNTLMAKDQGGLLSAVERQLKAFRENNPNGFTASSAEQFRQWLNQVRSPANKWAIGQLVGAVDNDVTSAAGEDIYGQARALNALKMRTLDQVDDLMDTTESARLPDTLTRLDPAKYQQVVKLLEGMPPELQPDAQAALGEMRAHLLNKLQQAGTQTSRGVPAAMWGTDRVQQVLKTNAAKFRIAFAGDRAAQQGLEDLESAGQILRANPAYPGADAQAANALKRGLISRTLGHLGGSAGAAGGAFIAGPIGAAAGGAIGESAGLSMGQKAAERAALKAWAQRVRPTGANP